MQPGSRRRVPLRGTRPTRLFCRADPAQRYPPHTRSADRSSAGSLLPLRTFVLMDAAGVPTSGTAARDPTYPTARFRPDAGADSRWHLTEMPYRSPIIRDASLRDALPTLRRIQDGISQRCPTETRAIQSGGCQSARSRSSTCQAKNARDTLPATAGTRSRLSSRSCRAWASDPTGNAMRPSARNTRCQGTAEAASACFNAQATRRARPIRPARAAIWA